MNERKRRLLEERVSKSESDGEGERENKKDHKSLNDVERKRRQKNVGCLAVMWR